MEHIDPTAQYGHMSPYADLTPLEFGMRNTLQASKKELKKHALRAKQTTHNFSLQSKALPTEFDWTTQGAVNEVKDQAQCGSCWAFATVASIEGANFLTNKELVSLSEQELVDCDSEDNGCEGGLPSNAYDDLISNGMGLELESDYPYTASDDTCSDQKSLEKVFISDWKSISDDEDEIAQALMTYGPLAIGINASYMQLYTGGISDPAFCDPLALDHGVVIVGFGEENGTKFWKIRNSWGAGWGEEGYYRIVRGQGKCGLNRMVTAAIAKASAKKARFGAEIFV